MKFTGAACLLVFLCVVLPGCDSDEIVQPQPRALPPNDTPENTVERFTMAYERMDTTAYEELFTADFLYEFSNSADPDLATEYSAGWFKEDERISARNLFRGGVNNDGQTLLAAQSIALDLTATTTEGDTVAGRDSLKHRVLFTPIRLEIQLPPTPDNPDGTTFIVGGADPAVHRFFLVRGDEAANLDAEQPADSLHWYIWLWRDETVFTARANPGGFGQPVMAEGSTWGKVKGLYR